MVDVSVRDSGRPVTGLTVADFVLTDNGVRQQVESVEAAAVPIDLTLVMDVSGNPRAAVGAAGAAGEDPRRRRGGSASGDGLLRPDDRVRLLARHIHAATLALQPVGRDPAPSRVSSPMASRHCTTRSRWHCSSPSSPHGGTSSLPGRRDVHDQCDRCCDECGHGGAIRRAVPSGDNGGGARKPC